MLAKDTEEISLARKVVLKEGIPVYLRGIWERSGAFLPSTPASGHHWHLVRCRHERDSPHREYSFHLKCQWRRLIEPEQDHLGLDFKPSLAKEASSLLSPGLQAAAPSPGTAAFKGGKLPAGVKCLRNLTSLQNKGLQQNESPSHGAPRS